MERKQRSFVTSFSFLSIGFFHHSSSFSQLPAKRYTDISLTLGSGHKLSRDIHTVTASLSSLSSSLWSVLYMYHNTVFQTNYFLKLPFDNCMNQDIMQKIWEFFFMEQLTSAVYYKYFKICILCMSSKEMYSSLLWTVWEHGFLSLLWSLFIFIPSLWLFFVLCFDFKTFIKMICLLLLNCNFYQNF